MKPCGFWFYECSLATSLVTEDILTWGSKYLLETVKHLFAGGELQFLGDFRQLPVFDDLFDDSTVFLLK